MGPKHQSGRVASVIAAMAVFASVVMTASPAAAAEVLYDEITPGTYTAPAYNQPMRQITMAAVSINVTAGQITYVSGYLTFANPTVVTLVDSSVQCLNGGASAGKVVHGENIFPSSYNAQHAASVTGRLLATSSTTGVLSCTLYAFVRSLGVNASTFSITGGHLQIGRRSVPGGVQAASTERLARVGSPVWTPYITGSASLPGYTGLWRAPTGTTTLNVISNVSLTVCKRNGDKFGCPGADGTSGASVRTTIFVTQFNSNGTVCRQTTDPKTAVISDAQHHDVAYHQIPSVAVLTSGSCVPVFSIYMRLDVLSGRPVATHNAASAGAMGLVFVLPT